MTYLSITLRSSRKVVRMITAVLHNLGACHLSHASHSACLYVCLRASLS